MKIYTKIGLGMGLGVVAGLALGSAGPGAAEGAVGALSTLGEAFLRLLTMVIVPLVFASITLGITALGADAGKLGRVGAITLTYFLVTTVVSVGIGIGLAEVIRPGAGVDRQALERLKAADVARRVDEIAGSGLAGRTPGVRDLLLNVIPRNPIRALADGDMLQVIFFAFFLGIALALVAPEKQKTFVAWLEGLNEAMVKCVELVMKTAPYGVFCLLASITARFGADVILLLLRYGLTSVLGQAIVLLGLQAGSVAVLARIGPLRFLRAIREAMLVAFTTSSSNATLPFTMACCEKNLGISRQVTSFVTALGATINMNGTALYQGVAAVFIAQVYGVPLTLGQEVTIVATATLAAIGTAGVPGVGLVTLVMVLGAAGIPPAGIALIMGMDRILDMVRTVTNITGDCAAAAIVARAEGEFRRERREKKEALEDLV